MSSRTVPAAKTKEGLRSSVLPPKRSTPMAALRFVFVGLPARAAWTVRVMPWWQRIVLLLLVLIACSASTYFLVKYRAEEHRKGEISARWKDFELHAAKLDRPSMTADLDRLEQLQPGDPLVKKRQESLARGSGDGDDPVMNVYWMKMNRGLGNIDAQVVEANKRIATAPDDWLARCILAEAAIKRYNKENEATIKQQCLEEANAHLKALPSPFDSRAMVGPADLDYAIELNRCLKRDYSSLRRFRATQIVPLMKDPEIVHNDPRLLVSLLKSYVESFEDIGTYNELVTYWIGSNRIAQFLAKDPASSAEILMVLGDLQIKQLIVLEQQIAAQRIAGDNARAFRQELADRIDDIWGRVRNMKPDSPEGYLGLAMAAEIQNRRDKALAYIEKARQRSGDDQRYLEYEQRFLRAYGNAGAEFNLLQEEFDKKGDQTLLRKMADAAMRDGQIDKALEVARKARKIDPKQAWTAIMEARVLLEREEVDDALEVLKEFKSVAVQDPVVSELYVRALCLKSPKEVRPFLDKVVAEAIKTKRPDAFVPSLRKAQQAGLNDDLADLSAQLAKAFPAYNRNLLLVVADSNGASAEPKTDMDKWNETKLQIALNAYRSVHEVDPDDREVANSLAWLLVTCQQVKGAETAAAPLYKWEGEGHKLPPNMLNTLAAIDLAKSHYDEARRHLLQITDPLGAAALTSRKPTAEEYIHLALAYMGLNQNDEARDYLVKAASSPCSPRVSQELKKAQKLLERKP